MKFFRIVLVWRNRNGKIAKWSGLIEDGTPEDPPALVLRRNADQGGPDTTLEVRWKVDPANLEKSAAAYRVIVQSDMDQDLCVREVAHRALRGGEKYRFSNSDFEFDDEDTLLSAKVMVEVVGNPEIEREESDEFIIRFGQPPVREAGGVGVKVRTFSEGLAHLESRETVSSITSSAAIGVSADSKGFILLRTPVERGRRKSFKVFRPALIADVEREWIEREGEIGRWTVKVRGNGNRAGAAEFEPFEGHDGSAWKRVRSASRKMAQRFGQGVGVAQVYDGEVATFGIVQEYLRAWVALLEQGEPRLSLANTVEVQSLSGRTVGLIVLPAHPSRVAWHSAYDNLVLDTAFEKEQKARDIRKEFDGLDGAMFPAFLPNPDGGHSFSPIRLVSMQ